MPGSTLGTQRPGDLWFQGNFSPQDSSLPAHPGQARVMQAFLEAGGLQKPDTAQRIASSFNDGIQPYRAMTEALALINPMASARIAALAPRSNSNFGIGLVFFLLCLRHGGVRRWLEDALEDDGEPDGGPPDLLEYFDRQIMPRRIAIQGNGSWDVVIVPFTAGELTQLVWAIRPDEQGSADPAGRQRFALQVRIEVPRLEGDLLRLDLEVDALAGMPLHARLVEAVQQTHGLQRGDALRVGRHLVDGVAAVVEAEGTDPVRVVGGQVVVRPMMYLALSYDHRIVDGKEAVTFLVRVKESLEDPERLVLDL